MQFFLVPIPYYQGQAFCTPCPNNTTCPSCKSGWYLGEPLWKKVLDYFSYINKPANVGDALVTVTSTPVPASQNESSSSAASPILNGIVETANWKTFNDEYYKFSIKYPSSWQLNDSGSPAIFRSSDGKQSFNIELGEPIISLDKQKAKRTEESIIGGVKATKYFIDRISLGYDSYEMLIIVNATNGDYYITASNKVNDFTEINQILSTF